MRKSRNDERDLASRAEAALLLGAVEAKERMCVVESGVNNRYVRQNCQQPLGQERKGGKLTDRDPLARDPTRSKLSSLVGDLRRGRSRKREAPELLGRRVGSCVAANGRRARNVFHGPDVLHERRSSAESTAELIASRLLLTIAPSNE